MSIFGVGAYFGGNKDVSGDFIKENIVGVGWNEKEAPELQEYFKALKVGDIIYIKAAFGATKYITVKAIGIIKDQEIITSNKLVTTGRNVKWLSKEQFIIQKPKEKNNVRSNTVYEEFHPEVLKEIISRIN